MNIQYLQIGNVTIKIISDIFFELDENLQKFAVEIPDEKHMVQYLLKQEIFQLPESCHKVHDSYIKVYKDKSGIYREHTYADGTTARKGYCVRNTVYNDCYEFFVDVQTNRFTLYNNLIPLEEIIAYHGGIVLHSSCVEYQGQGLLFSAPSGTGKTTQAELWNQYMGARIINGDRCVLMKIDGIWCACGCFYKGSSHYCESVCIPVAAIITLGQAPENVSYSLRAKEKFVALYKESIIHTWNPEYVDKIVDTLMDCLNQIRMEHFVCLPQESAVWHIKGRIFS